MALAKYYMNFDETIMFCKIEKMSFKFQFQV